MNGQTAGNLNYETWLRKQPQARQKEVLGKGRYELFKSNKMPLSALTNINGKSISLEQLRNKYLT